jgi:diguanylate cyclase
MTSLLLASGVLMASGGTLAVVLMGIGFSLGMRMGKQRAEESGPITQRDRERMLHLLQELGSWTSEYSGNVSQYQNRLGELSEAVAKDEISPQAGNRVLLLLKQIMESNEQLQTRLEAAERQLEKQTQQIESYLSEARTDGLTGLYNRRAFDQRLDQIFAAYRKGGRSFVLVLVDIDHFKSINDNHGHQVGDDVLKEIARNLKTQLDDATIVARFGGEEFVAILGGPLRVASARMNEVRKFIADQRHEVPGGKLYVTISIGISEPRNDVLIGPIVRRADEALYAAKKMGRNRVYFHDGVSPTLVGAPEISRDSGPS